MSPGKSSIFAALLAAVLTAGWLFLARQHRAGEIAQLREANRSLRIASQTTKPPAAKSDLRPEAAGVSLETGAPAAAPKRTYTDYRNAGNATPQATLQTFAWACDQMDTELLAKLVYFEPAARAKAAAFHASLPEKMRAEWPTLEDFAAIGLADAMQYSRFPPAIILEKAELEQVDDNRVILHLNGAAKERTEYQRTESGWKYVITEKMADAFLASVNAKQGK
jgi:hypothetical protein